MVINNFDADMFALEQGINPGKQDKNTEKQPVGEPAPEERAVEDIPGRDINGRDEHNDEYQIAEYFAQPAGYPIDPVEKLVDALRHLSAPRVIYPGFQEYVALQFVFEILLNTTGGCRCTLLDRNTICILRHISGECIILMIADYVYKIAASTATAQIL